MGVFFSLVEAGICSYRHGRIGIEAPEILRVRSCCAQNVLWGGYNVEVSEFTATFSTTL
jgi:hypothetical protein